MKFKAFNRIRERLNTANKKYDVKTRVNLVKCIRNFKTLPRITFLDNLVFRPLDYYSTDTESVYPNTMGE